MKAIILAACLAAFCVSGTSAGPNDRAMIKAPSEWSPEERASFTGTTGFISLCIIYQKGGYAPGVDLVPLTGADFEIIEVELRKRGLSDFDVAILRQRKGNQLVVGQSFAGLVCEIRRTLKLNKSFSVGVGHRWQAVLPDRFVYLSGDGTSSGMRVTGWN